MKSWKTTLFGAVSALGVFFTAQSNAILHVVGMVLSAIGTLGTGIAAQDATKQI